MRDENKTKLQLIEELQAMRCHVAELEHSETKQKQARCAYRESEERFERLFNKIGDAIFVTKIGGMDRGRILEGNPMAVVQTGYTRTELLDMNISTDLAICKTGEIKQDDWDQRLLKGETITTTEKKRRKDGSQYWVEVVVTLIDYNGTKACLSINRDITDRKLAENKLKRSEERYKSLFENMHSGFALHEMVFDGTGTPSDYIFLDVNKAFEMQTNLKREKLIGRKVTEALPGIENDSFDWIGTYGKVVLSGRNISFENYWGSLKKWYSVIAYRANKGQFAVILRDITGYKQKEELLRESENRYRTLFERQSDAVFIYDPDTTNILDANKATSKIYCYKKEELIGMSCLKLSAEVEESSSTIDSIRENKEVNVPIRYHRKKDGTVFPVEVNGYTITLGGKNVMFAVSKEITERKKAEGTLKLKLEELERFNKSMVGRELKMIKLKKEVNRLCSQLNIPEKYRIPDDSK